MKLRWPGRPLEVPIPAHPREWPHHDHEEPDEGVAQAKLDSGLYVPMDEPAADLELPAPEGEPQEPEPVSAPVSATPVPESGDKTQPAAAMAPVRDDAGIGIPAAPAHESGQEAPGAETEMESAFESTRASKALRKK